MSNAFVSRCAHRILIGAAAALLCVFAVCSHAYVVNSFISGSETLYLKWGDNHAGTPGGIVYWSILPAGTPGDATYCGDACAGSSVDSISIEISTGGGFSATPLTTLESKITAMMAQWSMYSGIQFVKLASDSGAAINATAAVPPATGQIRIGIFHFASGGGGVGFAPPPNGGTGAGDILFDANSYYQFAPGNEGDSYSQTYAPNDFQSLMLHELGHAVGLEHPPSDDGTCPVMYVNPPCVGIIKRQLEADDIAGMVFLYDRIFANGFE